MGAQPSVPVEPRIAQTRSTVAWLTVPAQVVKHALLPAHVALCHALLVVQRSTQVPRALPCSRAYLQNAQVLEPLLLQHKSWRLQPCQTAARQLAQPSVPVEPRIAQTRSTVAWLTVPAQVVKHALLLAHVAL